MQTQFAAQQKYTNNSQDNKVLSLTTPNISAVKQVSVSTAAQSMATTGA